MANAARKPTKADNERRALAHELVGIHRTHRIDLERADGIKAELKAIATADGEKFGEMFPGEGEVKVSGDKAASGVVPRVDAEAFLALSDARRQKLIDDGVIVLEPARASYGRVTVKLF